MEVWQQISFPVNENFMFKFTVTKFYGQKFYHINADTMHHTEYLDTYRVLVQWA
jgi:hypothetical protein